MEQTKQKPQQFTPHDYAVFRYVWSLNEHERQRLDRCFMLKTTGHHLQSLLDTKHAWKDLLLNNDVEYELVYQDCCNDMLDTTFTQKILLLSFRYHRKANLMVVLVKEPYSNADLSIYKEL